MQQACLASDTGMMSTLLSIHKVWGTLNTRCPVQAWIAAANEANADEQERMKLRAQGKAPPNNNGFQPVIWQIA